MGEIIPECGKELSDAHQISPCIFVRPLAVRRMFKLCYIRPLTFAHLKLTISSSAERKLLFPSVALIQLLGALFKPHSISYCRKSWELPSLQALEKAHEGSGIVSRSLMFLGVQLGMLPCCSNSGENHRSKEFWQASDIKTMQKHFADLKRTASIKREKTSISHQKSDSGWLRMDDS